MKRFFCLAMIAMMLMSTACAQILTTGSVNVRSGPGLDYEAIGIIEKGQVLLWLEDVEEDYRGVEWYHIGYKNLDGWVSSKYAKSLVGEAAEVSVKEIRKYKEAAVWYDKELAQAARNLELDYKFVYDPSEIPVRYYNEALMIAGYEDVRCMRLYGKGYSIYGAAVGMKIEEACVKLEESGLELYREDECCVDYQRPTPEGSDRDYADYDSIIHVNYKDGIVYELDWQGYTG